MSAGNRNEFRQTLIGFANWCIRPSVKRMLANPFSGVPIADARLDQRRNCRSMTEAELILLLDVAQRRPLLEAMTVRRGKNKGQLTAKVRTRSVQLEQLGRERALIYKTLVLTGLRKGELASLTVGRLHLDGATAHLELEAGDEKPRGNQLAIRSDLADDLRQWLASKLQAAQDAATEARKPVPDRLPGPTPLFNVPTGLLRILDRDLTAADIAKKDDRGRTLDVHALRHSFGTLLSVGGVGPRTAQAAMRHSSIDLTMGVYTDRLCSRARAFGKLPSLPLPVAPNREKCGENARNT